MFNITFIAEIIPNSVNRKEPDPGNAGVGTNF